MRLNIDDNISDSMKDKLRKGDDAILISTNETMKNELESIELDTVIKTES